MSKSIRELESDVCWCEEEFIVAQGFADQAVACGADGATTRAAIEGERAAKAALKAAKAALADALAAQAVR